MRWTDDERHARPHRDGQLGQVQDHGGNRDASGKTEIAARQHVFEGKDLFIKILQVVVSHIYGTFVLIFS